MPILLSLKMLSETIMNIEQMKIVLKEIATKTDLTPCVVGHTGEGEKPVPWGVELRLEK